MGFAGCSYSQPDPTEPSPTPTVKPIAEVLHPEPDAAISKVVAFLDSQRGQQSVGTFTRENDILFVDLTCVGTGVVDVVIQGVGDFPLPCTPAGLQQTHSEFDISFVDTYAVSVVATAEQLWGITISIPAA